MIQFVTTPVRLSELVVDAAGNLWKLKARAALAFLGIAIGTSAVIAMLHIGTNAREEAMREFRALGIDLISITPNVNSAGNTSILPVDNLSGLISTKIGIADVAPVIQSGTTLRIGRHSIQTNILFTSDALYSLAGVQIQVGRFTSQLDRDDPFAVLGAELVRDIETLTGQTIVAGAQIIAGDVVFTVVGILQPCPTNPILGLDLDRSVIFPFAASRRLIENSRITSIAARLSPGSNDVQTSDAVIRYFRAQAVPSDVRVQTARQLIDGIDRQMRVYRLLLLAIGGVSMVVGGVGVMNVMLMSVMERRAEIGLRRAIGARRTDIRFMFLFEATMLSGIGSCAGVLIGTIAAWAFAASSGWRFVPASEALPLAILMAVVVGIFFGSYPAVCAARLSPVTALRMH